MSSQHHGYVVIFIVPIVDISIVVVRIGAQTAVPILVVIPGVITVVTPIVSVTGYDENHDEIFRNPDCKVEVLLDTFRRGIAEAAYTVIGFARLNEALTFSTKRSPCQGDAELPGHFMTHNDRRRNTSEAT